MLTNQQSQKYSFRRLRS